MPAARAASDEVASAPAAPPSLGRRLWPPVALAALSLGLVWSVDRLPTQDGPVHVYLSAVLRDYDEPALAALRETVAFNGFVHPNALIYALLPPAMAFAGVWVAEKLAVSLYILLFLFAARYTGRALNDDPSVPMLLFYPAMLGYCFHMGFYNNAFGLALSLLGLGLAIRFLGGEPRKLLAIGALSALLYFTHAFAFIAFLTLAALLALSRLVSDAVTDSDAPGGFPARLARAARTHAPRTLLPLALAFAPAAIVLARFSLAQNEPASGLGLDAVDLTVRAISVASFRFLQVYSARDLWLAAPLLAILVAVYCIYRPPSPARADRRDARMFLLAALAFLAIFMLVPESAGGTIYVLERLHPFLYLAIVLFLLRRSRFRERALPLKLALCLFAVALVGYRFLQYRQIDAGLEAVLQVARAEPAPETVAAYVVYPLTESGAGFRAGAGVRPLHNALGHLYAGTGTTMLSVFQLGTEYFPLRYRHARDPYRCVEKLSPEGGYERGPLDLDCYRRLTGAAPELFVLIGAARRGRLASLDRLLDQLEAGYAPAARSLSPLPVRVFRRKPG